MQYFSNLIVGVVYQILVDTYMDQAIKTANSHQCIQWKHITPQLKSTFISDMDLVLKTTHIKNWIHTDYVF